MTSPAPTGTASNTLLLRRQLTELTKRPVDGFSAGTVPAPLSASIVQMILNSMIFNFKKALSMITICTSGRS